MFGTKVHLSIGGMSEANPVETLPIDRQMSQESKIERVRARQWADKVAHFLYSYNQMLKYNDTM